MLITSDITSKNWNKTTVFAAHIRQALPTTTSSAPTSPLYATSQEPLLPETKNYHKKIKTRDQTIVSENIPINQETLFTQPESLNKLKFAQTFLREFGHSLGLHQSYF